jgi:hypothetical protein
MITKNQIICELLHHVRLALDEKLTQESYVDYLKGNVSFRLDLVLKPQRVFVNLNLPSKETGKPLEIQFIRRHTRRQFIELPPKDTVN